MPPLTKIVAEHAEALWTALDEEAAEKEVAGQTLRLFNGSMMDAYRKIGVSRSYYTRLWQALQYSGSIDILQRGSRNQNSVIVLHGSKPVLEGFQMPSAGDLTGPEGDAILSLTGRVAILEALVGGMNLRQVLGNFDKRIKAIESMSSGGTQDNGKNS